MLCKEEMHIVFFLTGLFLFYFQKERSLGIMLMSASIILGILYFKVLIPICVTSRQYYEIGYLSDFFVPGAALKRVFSFKSLQYLLLMFSPLLGTAFLSGGFIVTFIVTLLITLNLDWPKASMIYYHYTGSILPFIFVASIYGFKKLPVNSEYFNRFALGYILAHLFFMNLFFAHYMPYNGSWFKIKNHDLSTFQNIRSAGKLIPREAALIVDNSIGYFSFRKELYVLSIRNIDSLKRFQEVEKKADRVLVYVRPRIKEYLEYLAAKDKWRVLYLKNDLLLLGRSGTGPVLTSQKLKNIYREGGCSRL
jgi:uncharacterized membrane protein